MQLHRAISILDVRSISEQAEFFVIEGVATTPATDRMQDSVNPLGARFAKEIPLLWQHQADKPIGVTTLGKPTKSGIPFVARIPNIKEAGTLKDRVDEAVQSIRYGLVRAVSIGFRVINDAVERLGDGLRFNEFEIMELSTVTIPALPEAVITAFKNSPAVLKALQEIDQQHRTALGAARGQPLPGVSGKQIARKGIPLIPRKK